MYPLKFSPVKVCNNGEIRFFPTGVHQDDDPTPTVVEEPDWKLELVENDPPQLGCALANGQFVILNVKLIKNRPEEMRLYWQTPAEVDLGNPVSLIYKTSGQL